MDALSYFLACDNSALTKTLQEEKDEHTACNALFVERISLLENSNLGLIESISELEEELEVSEANRTMQMQIIQDQQAKMLEQRDIVHSLALKVKTVNRQNMEQENMIDQLQRQVKRLQGYATFLENGNSKKQKLN